MRALVHMRDVDSARKRLFRKIGATAFELRGAQALQWVDQAPVQAVFTILDNVDGAREVLLRGVKLFVSMLHDAEVRERLRGL